MTPRLGLPRGQVSGLQLFSGKKKRIFLKSVKRCLFPSVIVPLLCGEEIKPPPACPLVRTLELMTCPGWGVPGAAETSQAPVPFLSALFSELSGLARQVLFLSCKGVSPNSGLKETVRWGNFFFESGQNQRYIFILEVLSRSLRPVQLHQHVNMHRQAPLVPPRLRFSEVRPSGGRRLPLWSPSDSNTDVTDSTFQPSRSFSTRTSGSSRGHGNIGDLKKEKNQLPLLCKLCESSIY